MPTIPPPQPIPPLYRLVVTASQLKAKQFVWVIVNDANRGMPVETSKVTFRSLELAYNAGKGALEYWRAKTQRVVPAVDLAQPPPAKPQEEKPRPRRAGLTSSIYSRG
jgi:hypothetical protein